MYSLNGAVGSGLGKPYELPQNVVMPFVSTWEKASMYSSQPPLKLLSKKRWRYLRCCLACGGPFCGSLCTSVQRAKWMNDSSASDERERGNRRANAKTSGSHSRAHHLHVLNTVIAMAWSAT